MTFVAVYVLFVTMFLINVTMWHLWQGMFYLWPCFQLTSQCDNFLFLTIFRITMWLCYFYIRWKFIFFVINVLLFSLHNVSILYCRKHLLMEYIALTQLRHSMFCVWKCFRLTSQCDNIAINIIFSINVTMWQLCHCMFCLWKCFQLTSQCDICGNVCFVCDHVFN